MGVRVAKDAAGAPSSARRGPSATNVLLSQFGVLYHTPAFPQNSISTARKGTPWLPGRKSAADGSTKKLTKSELKQKIRELKKQRKEAGKHSAKAKVHGYNEELHIWRRKLRKAARKKKA